LGVQSATISGVTPPSAEQGWRSKIVLPAEILGLATLYFGCGKLGLSLAFLNASASAVWPPTGVALAVLVLYGFRLWPGVFIGAFLVNLTTQGSIATSLGIAGGNTLEALLGAWFTCRFVNGSRVLERTRDILVFLGLAALLSTAASATIGVTTLCGGGFGRWGMGRFGLPGGLET
jgi:integral membrane sensor domain MASE1